MIHTIKSEVLTVTLSSYEHGWMVKGQAYRFSKKRQKMVEVVTHRSYHATFEQAAKKIIDMNVKACDGLDQLADALETVRDQLLAMETV